MAELRMLVQGARMIGLRNALRAVHNSWLRDRLDSRYAPPPVAQTPRTAGSLRSAAPAPSGARLQFDGAQLGVRFLAPDLAFLGWDGADLSPSYAVVRTDWPPVDVSLEPVEAGWQLRSARMDLRVGHKGTIDLLGATGLHLRREGPPIRIGRGWRLSASLPAEACIYGLGERAGRLNLRPGTYRFWNRDAGGCYGPGCDPLYICMPLYMCLHQRGSYLVFYDNSFDGDVRLGDEAEIRFAGGPIRYYLACGSPAELLDRLSALTGRPQLPPRWTLGFQQSRWGYGSEAELRRIAGGFRRHGLPLSALVMDIDQMRGYRTLTTDEERYPSLPALAEELRAEGVHLVAGVNPGVKREGGFDLFDEGLDQDVFCRTPDGEPLSGVVWPGWTLFPDFTAPRGRAWWAQQYTHYLRQGVDGFWHDMNEPASFVAWGDSTLPLCTRHDLDGRGGDHREAHNVYGLLMNRAAFEGLRELRPEQRPWLLSRSGWVGMQRHAWTWTGDVETSWGALRQTVACVLGLGLSGVPYAGPDIGGFAGAPSPELFVRWFQLASFLPFFRTHCAFYLPRREPWQWGDEVMDLLRRQLQLRYRLLPYWYTLAWQASEVGQPLVRPLLWAEPENQALWQVDDAFLLGDALLVAPVLDKGLRSRPVYLPRGTWYELSDDRPHSGASEVPLQAPLDRLPVLVRAGSILPLEEGGELTLHLYRPGDGQPGAGVLYSDAGDGYGSQRVDRFDLQPAPDGFELLWSSAGAFAWPYRSCALHLHGFAAPQVSIEGHPVKAGPGPWALQPFQHVAIVEQSAPA